RWQARYQLPFVVGIPVLAASMLFTGKEGGWSRLRLPIAVVVVGATWLIYVRNLRRYTGGHASLAFWSNPSWVPPVRILVLLVGCALVAAVFAWWLIVLGADVGAGRDPARPTT